MPRRRGNRWVAFGYDRALGYSKHLGTYTTEGEAKNREAEHRLRTQPTGAETCDRFARRWVQDYPRPRASTNLHNAERVQRFAKDFEGVKLAAVDRPAARAWAMKHRSAVSSVRAMFGDAMRDGIVDLNPFANLRLPGSRGRKDIVALTEPELTALADVALSSEMEMGDFAAEYRAMVLFAGYVGLRPGELFALQAGDLRGDVCLIERALSSKTKEIGPTKNGRARSVFVPPVAITALEQVPPHRSGLLFESPAGRMWTQGSHHRYWSMLRRFAKRPGMDFYELRHAAATMLLERGVPHADVAQQLGHTDGGALVMSTYGHPAEAAARARISAAWGADVAPLHSISSAQRAQGG